MPEQGDFDSVDGGDSHSESTVETDSSFESVDIEDRDTLSMSVTVDISDMDDDDKEILEALAALYEESFQESVDKSRDYGWSFLVTGEKLTLGDGAPFENHTRSQAYGLLTRSGDKRQRIIQNLYGNGSSEVSDPPCVTAQENANYMMFLALILKHPELTKVLE